MAEAGYCSECGRDVELTPEGACPQGHGAECIGEPVGVPDSAEAALDPAPAEPAEAPVSAPVYPEPGISLPPQRSHIGLIVVVIAAIVILFAFLGTALLLVPVITHRSGGGSPTATTTAVPVVSPAKQQVETSIGFLKALFTEDAEAIKPYLVDAAQTAITAAQWKTIAANIPTVPVTFQATKWTTDTTAVVAFESEGTTGTLTFGTDAAKAGAVTLEVIAGGQASSAVVALTKVGTGWRVLSVTGDDGTKTVYDAKFVKQMLTDSSGG